MNQKTLRTTLAKIDPSYKITKHPEKGMTIMCKGKTIKLADSNSLGWLTISELRSRLGVT